MFDFEETLPISVCNVLLRVEEAEVLQWMSLEMMQLERDLVGPYITFCSFII